LPSAHLKFETCWNTRGGATAVAQDIQAAAESFTVNTFATTRAHQILERSNSQKLQKMRVLVSEDDLSHYHFDFGRDYNMIHYSIDLLFNTKTIPWNGEYRYKIWDPVQMTDAGKD
jgi:hypothetical protein